MMLRWSDPTRTPPGEFRELNRPDLNVGGPDFFKEVKAMDNQEGDIDDRLGVVEIKPFSTSISRVFTYQGDEESGEVAITMGGEQGHSVTIRRFSPTESLEISSMAISMGDSLTVSRTDHLNPENSTTQEWYLAR